MIQTQPPVSKEVLADWQRQLDELFPPSEVTSHLKIVWVSGDDWEVGGTWQGVERFYLYEMTPEAFTDPNILFELRDMPRPVVRYDTVMKDVVCDDRYVTRMQWDLYHETKCWGRPFWVIQGEKGGHKRFLTPLEKQWLTLASLPTEPPWPGTLPYAPFDQRVIRQVVHHDKLRQVGERLMVEKQSQKDKYKALHKQDEENLRRAIVDFLRDTITIDEGKEVKRAIRDTAVIQDAVDYEKLCDEAEQRFIESGRVVGTAK